MSQNLSKSLIANEMSQNLSKSLIKFFISKLPELSKNGGVMWSSLALYDRKKYIETFTSSKGLSSAFRNQELHFAITLILFLKNKMLLEIFPVSMPCFPSGNEFLAIAVKNY